MTRILALDTATEAASVAVYDGGELYCEVLCEKNRHTECLLPLVDKMLTASGLKLEDMDAVAFGAGPGAFTGLRVACGVAQGLAWAAGKTVLAVCNLAASAVRCFDPAYAGARIAVINDARMHECYAAVYEYGQNGHPAEICVPTLIEPQEVVCLCQENSATLVSGTAFAVYADEIALTEGFLLLGTEYCDAQDIVRTAVFDLTEGKQMLPQLAAPLYVRNRVAFTIEERKSGEKLWTKVRF